MKLLHRGENDSDSLETMADTPSLVSREVEPAHALSLSDVFLTDHWFSEGAKLFELLLYGLGIPALVAVNTGVLTAGLPLGYVTVSLIVAAWIHGVYRVHRGEVLDAAAAALSQEPDLLTTALDLVGLPEPSTFTLASRYVQGAIEARLVAAGDPAFPTMEPIPEHILTDVALHARDNPLRCAALKLLGETGGEKGLAIAEYLASRPGLLPGRRRVRLAARRAQDRLEERLRNGDLAPDPLLMSETLMLQDTPSRELSPESEAALRGLEEERKRGKHPSLRRAFLAADWMIIVPYTGVQAWTSFASGHWRAGLVWLYLVLLAAQLYRFALSPRQAAAAHELAARQDIQAVGPLAEALEWPDRASQNVAAAALTQILPRLMASDSALLNPAQRACLNRALQRDLDRPGSQRLALAILRAWQQLGDDEAIPYVQRLSMRPARSSRRIQVREASRECLLYLMQSASSASDSRSLLRAGSNTASEPPFTLVRPAAGRPDENHEALMRADLGGGT